MPEPAMPPKSMLRWTAVAFALNQIFWFVFIAVGDAQQDLWALRLGAVGLAFTSALVVVTGYLSLRRAWKDGILDDVRDGVLPFVTIAALGGGIWWLVHALLG